VIVIEEGSWFDKGDYGPWPPSETFRRIYRDAGTTMASGGPLSPMIALPLGRAVGGSTVVNGGVCYRTPPDILDEWERLGVPFARDEIERAFERVEDVIQVRPTREEVLGGSAAAFRRGAQKLGLRTDYMKRNTPDCEGCCRCIFGCPEDHKKAVHLSYIPRALAHGARIYAECRAESLILEGARAVGVRAVSDTGAKLTVRARAVVLALGAVHTPLFLAKHRLGGSSGTLGRNLAIHPSARILAEFDEPVDGHKGALQGLFSDALMDIGIKLNGIFLPPGLMGSQLPYVGAEARAALARYRNMAAFGAMVSDESVGRVIAAPWGPHIHYSLDPRDKELLVRGVIEAAKVWFAAGAKRVYPAIRGVASIDRVEELAKIDPRRVRATDLELGAFHPMGTARMSPNARRGVIDHHFEHHEVDGLHIADASWFPTSLRVNPQVTIMAFATIAAREIAECIGA
jgi:choline dehydrogenase-like flavoprotein